MTVFVDSEPVGRRGECQPEQSLLDCARQLGVGLVSLCAGAASCGRCVVQILEGETLEPGPDERTRLSPTELAQGYRLACRAIPLGECKVWVPPESLTTPQRTQIEGEEVTVTADPPLQTYRLKLPAASLEDLRAEATTMQTLTPVEPAWAGSQCQPSLQCLPTLSSEISVPKPRLGTVAALVSGSASHGYLKSSRL